LTKQYPMINDGEKIRYVYLKEPNPTKEKVIAFPMNLPKEFGLEKYVDYDMMFDKGFLAPLKAVLDVLNWKTETVDSLEDFFN
jgi:hypothetical protein